MYPEWLTLPKAKPSPAEGCLVAVPYPRKAQRQPGVGATAPQPSPVLTWPAGRDTERMQTAALGGGT